MENRRFELVHSSSFKLVFVVRIWTKRGSLKPSDWKNSDWKHRGTEAQRAQRLEGVGPSTSEPVLQYSVLGGSFGFADGHN